MQIGYDEVDLVLSGLNDLDDQGRRQFFLNGVTPTLNQAYAMIMKGEIQQLTCAVTTTEKTDLIVM